MFLKEILSITGHGGLFKHIAQTRNGAIVENLETKKRMPVFPSMQVSALEDISIYTNDGDISLYDVLKNINNKEESKQTISHNQSKDEIIKFFEIIIPNYDKDKFHIRDMKRVVQWYNIFQKIDMLKFEEEETTEKTETEEKTD